MNKPVLVLEGTSDINKIQSIYDDQFIYVITNGSSIDESVFALLEKLSSDHKIIVLTDPDYPGEQIRKKIASRINCYHAFVSKEKSIKGKKLGVAECSKDEIIKALNSYVYFSKDEENNSLSHQDFYSLGLTGPNSKELRDKVSSYYRIGRPNAKTLFKRLNMLNVKKEDLIKILWP